MIKVEFQGMVLSHPDAHMGGFYPDTAPPNPSDPLFSGVVARRPIIVLHKLQTFRKNLFNVSTLPDWITCLWFGMIWKLLSIFTPKTTSRCNPGELRHFHILTRTAQTILIQIPCGNGCFLDPDPLKSGTCTFYRHADLQKTGQNPIRCTMVERCSFFFYFEKTWNLFALWIFWRVIWSDFHKNRNKKYYCPKIVEFFLC